MGRMRMRSRWMCSLLVRSCFEVFVLSPEAFSCRLILFLPVPPWWTSRCALARTFAQMFLFVHFKNGSITCAVLAEVIEQQMNLAVLRLERLFTQVAIADHIKPILVEVVGTRVRVIALLHVLPPWGWPDDPWLLWLAENAVKTAMCGTPMSQKVLP